ncbi:hypothetical protein [Halorarius litoreus]|uniref:hypothetical protein n=1 Tax=Halorarius litoreus TaxID=2962676 RepID=UPI0020CD29A5|nr:hypothetical protein [Halorarius litoreus]
MSAGGSAPGRREVAHRLFAAEFDDADFSYSESDEERAPNYVVTPTGARVNRLFVVGVLTETEPVNEEMLRARIVDPTGAFVTYAGQYQPEALAFLERVDPPAFLAVTGKARTFQPDDSNRVYTSIRPESISEVDSATRDRWVVQAAQRTIERVETMAAAIDSGLSGDALREALEADGVDPALAAGIPLALDHYGTTPDYLEAVKNLAEDALSMVAGDVDEVGSLDVAPNEGAGDASSLADRELVTVAGTGETVAESEAGFEPPSEGTAASSPEDTESTASTAADRGASEAESEPEPETETAASSEPVGPESKPEPETASESEPAGESEPEPVESESESEPEPSTEPAEPATEPTTADTAAVEADESDDLDDIGDFEPDDEFDPDDEVLTDEEREEAEELGGFSTGNEVEEPGDTDTETPEPEPEPEAESTEEAAEADDAAEEEPETDAEPEPATDEGDADVDLDEAVMDAMTDLDDGDGAPHDDIVDAVVDRTGASPDDVEQAIQDALMSGQCYEPDDGVFKPI